MPREVMPWLLRARATAAALSSWSTDELEAFASGFTRFTADLAAKVNVVLADVLSATNRPLTRADRERITLDISDDILGHGPIEAYLRDEDVAGVLTLEGSVNSRDHFGGTAPAQVRAAVTRHRERLDAFLGETVFTIDMAGHPYVVRGTGDAARVGYRYEQLQVT